MIFYKELGFNFFFFSGFIIGFKNFFAILWEAFSGVLYRPLNEFTKTGFFGLFKGVWQGFTGFFIKPVVGAHDLVITISEGILNNS